MKSASEIKQQRDKELEKFNSRKSLIDGQWKYIEGKVDQFKITKDTKYIDLGNIQIYDECIEKLINKHFYIDKGKNYVHLYFDKDDYDKMLAYKNLSSSIKDTTGKNPIIGNKEDINNIKDKLNEKSEEREKDNKHCFAKVKVNDNNNSNCFEFETITDLLKYINSIVR